MRNQMRNQLNHFLEATVTEGIAVGLEPAIDWEPTMAPINEALQVGALSVALFSAKVGKSRTSQNFGINMFFPLADCPYR